MTPLELHDLLESVVSDVSAPLFDDGYQLYYQDDYSPELDLYLHYRYRHPASPDTDHATVQLDPLNNRFHVSFVRALVPQEQRNELPHVTVTPAAKNLATDQ